MSARTPRLCKEVFMRSITAGSGGAGRGLIILISRSHGFGGRYGRRVLMPSGRRHIS